MTSMGSRKGATPAGTILMILAFAAIAGFLYWLSVTAEPSNIQIVQDEEPEDVPVEVIALTPDSFAADPGGFVGRTVRVINLTSTNLLGAQAFMVGLPNEGGDYIVRMGEEVVSQGLVVFPGDNVHVTGVVQEMTQEVADGWVAEGLIGEGDQESAMVNPTFILASDVEIVDAGQ